MLKLGFVAFAWATRLSKSVEDVWEARDGANLPLVVNTWVGDFSSATERAWAVLSSGGTTSALLDAVEQVSESMIP